MCWLWWRKANPSYTTQDGRSIGAEQQAAQRPRVTRPARRSNATENSKSGRHSGLDVLATDSPQHKEDDEDVIRPRADELEGVRKMLQNWFRAKKVTIDPSKTAASAMLSEVFVRYNSRMDYLNEELATRIHEIQIHESERSIQKSKIDSLNQKITELKRQLTSERDRHELLKEAHKKELTDQDERQKLAISAHREDRDKEIKRLTLVHKGELDQLNEAHIRKVKELEEEIGGLKLQHSLEIECKMQKLSEIEEAIRMSVDNFQARQDLELMDRFYRLSYSIESLARLSPASDFMQRAQAKINIQIPPTNQRRVQRYLLQNVLWTFVLKGIFCTPFRVFGVYGDPVYETWKTLFGGCDGSLTNCNSDSELFRWPPADLLAEKWRYTTIERLRVFRTHITTIHSKLAMLFSSSLSALDAEVDTIIHNILTQAVEFVLLISLERCRVCLFLPSLLGERMPRNTDDIKDINPEMEGEAPFGKVEFVVMPGLSKEGNPRGGNLDKRTVLTKAVVYFSLEEGAE